MSDAHVEKNDAPDAISVSTAASVSDERVARFGEWLNRWGDLDKKPQRRSRDWREGYEEAIRNAYDLFENLYPSWPTGGTDGS